MASLSNTKIKDTYESLVKFSDNGNITIGAKQLTDGFGNNSPFFVSTTQIGIGVTPAVGYDLHVNSNSKIGGNLVVSGNLTVSGTLTYLNVEDFATEDPLIKLARNNDGNSLDIGYFGQYVESAVTKFKGLFNDADDNKFKLFIGTSTVPTTVVNTGGTGYTVGTLVANLEGNVTGGTISGTTGTFSGDLSANNLSGTNTGDQTLPTDFVSKANGGTFSGDVTITSSGLGNSPTLAIDNPTSNSFIHSIEAFGANLTSGQTNIIVLGKEGTTKNSAYIGYNWNADASDTNYITLGHWNADHLVKIYASGAITFINTITSTKNGIAFQMDGGASAEGIRLQADSSGTYPVFLKSVNPASGETSPWIYKEHVPAWGIWHNNPVNSFDFTRSTIATGIQQDVGGETNTVMIRLNNTDGSGTFVGNISGAAISGTTGSFSGNVTAPSFTGDLTGDVTGNAYLNTTAYQGGEGTELDNSAFNVDGIGTNFRWIESNSGATGTTWKKVADVVLNDTGFNNGVQMEVKVLQPNTNWGDNASLNTIYYSIAFRGDESDTGPFYDDALVYGQDADLIRVYKTSTHNYELQARSNDDNRDLIVECNITSKKSAKVTFTTVYTDGTITGGTAYTASGNALNKTKFAGNVEFEGAIFDDAEVDDLRVNEFLYLGAQASSTYGPYLIHTDLGSGTGYGAKLVVRSDFQVWGVTGNAGEQNQGLYVAGGVAKLYDMNGVVLETVLGGVEITGTLDVTGLITNTYSGTSTHVLKNATSNGTVLRLDCTGDSSSLYLQGDHIYASGVLVIGDGSSGANYYRATSHTFQSGTVEISTINNATTDTDKFLVSDSGVIKYRTGAEVASDISSTLDGQYVKYNGTTQETTSSVSIKLKNTATGDGGYSEIQLLNDNDDKIVVGSIGSGYTGVDWIGATYVYNIGTSRKMYIKSQDELRFFSGGTGITANTALVLDTSQNATFSGTVETTQITATNGLNYLKRNTDASLQLRSENTRSGLFITKPATDTVMGSALVLADESYRLGTANYYHMLMLQDGNTYFNQNLGIGTPTPLYPLHISIPYAKTSTGTQQFAAIFTTNEAAASNPFGLRIGIIGAAAIANRYAALQTTDYNLADGGNIVMQGSGGNVSIGKTSTIDAPLVVYRTGDVWHSVIGNDTGQLRIGGQTSSSGAVIQSRNQAGTARDLYLQRDGGRIGIGTNNPNALLSLGPTGGQKIYVYESGVIRSGFGIDLSGSSRELSIFSTSSNGTTGNISFGYRLETDGSYVEKMRISSNGELNVKGNLMLSVASSFIKTTTGDLYLSPASFNTTLYNGVNPQILNIYNGASLSIKLDSASGTYGGVLLNLAGTNFVHGISGQGLVLSHHNVGSSNAIISGDATNPDTLFINNGGAANDWSNVVIYGAVGVGDLTPDYKLTVAKTSIAAPAFMVSGAYYGGPRIQTYGLDADPNAWMGLGTDMSGASYEHSIYFSDTGSSGRLSMGTYNGTTYSEKMCVLRTGNVGIGASNLNTISGTNPTLTLGGTGISGGLILQRAGTDKARLYENAGLMVHQGMTGVGHSFYVNASTDAMTIDTSGNVGIGNANPSAFNSLGGKNLVVGDGTQTNNLTLFSATTGGTVGYGHIAFADSNTSGSTAQYAGLIQYYHGNDSMQFYTNATPRMTIDNDGDMGIGKTNPDAPLVVYRTGDVWHTVIGNDTGQIRFGGQTGSGAVIQSRTQSGTGRDLYIQRDSGNTGIRLNDAKTILHIGPLSGGNGTAQERLRLSGDYNGTNSGALLRFTNQHNSATNPNTGEYNLGGIIAYDFRSDWGGALALQTAPNTSAGGTLVNRLVINPEGLIGIGTNDPNALLSLGGSGGQKLYVYESGTVRAGFGVDLSGSSRELSMFHTSSNASDGNTSFGYRLESTGAYQERMRITGAGAVNIGTTSTYTGTRLNVEGERIGVRTSNSSWGQLYVANPGDGEVGIAFGAGGTGRPGGTSTYTRQWIFGVNPFGIGQTKFGLTNKTLTSNPALTIIENTGAIGLRKVSPSYQLDVTGSIRASSDVIAFSDKRVKENIITVNNALEKVTKLRGVTYTRKDTDDKSTKLGVIAQEVLEVLPEVVAQDKDGMYSVAYGNMAGVFIEAIKELKAEVDSLKQEIKQLKK